MNILCNAVTINHNSLSDKRLTVHCEEVRADLVLQEVINEKGAEFVLNALGDKAIADYLNKQAIAA